MIIEECLKYVHSFVLANILVDVACRWTNQRKAFGKPLNSQAVIRSKLASMIARAESVQAWLENITYQMNNMVCRFDSTFQYFSSNLLNGSVV